MPVNPRRLRQPRQHTLYVSLAGPLTNFVLAALLAVVYRLWGAGTDGWFGDFVFVAGLLNVVLGLFNLLPIPPLDGSAVLERLLPERWWPAYLKFRRYSFFLLLALMFLFVTRGNSPIFEPAWRVWLWMAGESA